MSWMAHVSNDCIILGESPLMLHCQSESALDDMNLARCWYRALPIYIMTLSLFANHPCKEHS